MVRRISDPSLNPRAWHRDVSCPDFRDRLEDPIRRVSDLYFPNEQ
jgi:hypothetical protein